MEIDESLTFKHDYVDDLKSICITAVDEKGIVDVMGSNNNLDPPRIISGMAFEILQDMIFMLNFSTKFIPSDDYFDNQENHTSPSNSSIAYQLSDGQADIAIGYFYYLVPRLQYGKLMVPLSGEIFNAYYHTTAKNAFRNVFKEPFSSDLIICFGITMSVIGLTAVCLVDYSLKSSQSFLWKTEESFFWTVAVISQQGFKLKLPTFSVRIVISIGTFLSFLLNAYYSGAIIAFLTVESGMMTYYQLVNYGYSFYANRSLTTSLLQDNKNAKPVKMLNIEYDESIRLIFQNNYAHAHLDTLDQFSLSLKNLNISAQVSCNKISRVPFSGGSLKSGFYARKDFPYHSLFNSKFLKIMQVGLLKRSNDMYKTKTIFKCPNKSKKYQDDLRLDDLLSAFIGLLISVILSIIVLLVEKCLSNENHNAISVIGIEC